MAAGASWVLYVAPGVAGEEKVSFCKSGGIRKGKRDKGTLGYIIYSMASF